MSLLKEWVYVVRRDLRIEYRVIFKFRGKKMRNISKGDRGSYGGGISGMYVFL